MGNINLTKDKSTSIISIVIAVAAYAIERLVEIFVDPSRTVVFGLSVGMTLAVVVVYALLIKNKNAFYGILAALIGYKMLPPSISKLKSLSVAGDMIYYLIGCAATVIFLVFIYHFYKLQKGKDKIQALPLLVTLVTVPFFSQIAEKSYYFIMFRTGNMLYYYFSCFACYIIACLVILLIAYKSNYASMRFVTYFEFVALGINALKKIGAVIAMAVAGDHISRSYYVWIVIYAVLACCFLIAKNMKKKQEK